MCVVGGSGCDQSYEEIVSHLDHGRLNFDGELMRPTRLPWCVSWADDFPVNYVVAGMSFWNDQAMQGGDDRDWQWFRFDDGICDQLVYVRYGNTRTPYTMGETHFVYDGNRLLSAEVIISGLIDRDNVVAVLRHELGHCMGLADDPGHPTSVMSYGLDMDTVTQSDLWMLLQGNTAHE
jgi:hypothetical protein